MNYRLAAQSGDATPVPQLVFARLASAGENYIRVALYILSTGSTDARDIAHGLSLKSVRTAQDALKWWAGAGLLEIEHAPSAPPAVPVRLTQADINLAAMRDPMVSLLAKEAQQNLGKTMSARELQTLVGLYLNDGWAPEVILLCCAHMATQGKSTLAAVQGELRRWQNAGVETGEQAEAYLELLRLRAERQRHVAALLSLPEEDLQLAERQMINRWYENYEFDDSILAEAILVADGKQEVRYINGILRGWHGRGYRTVQEIRGSGELRADNLRVDRTTPSGTDYLRQAGRRPLRLKREE